MGAAVNQRGKDRNLRMKREKKGETRVRLKVLQNHHGRDFAGERRLGEFEGEKLGKKVSFRGRPAT